MTISNWPLYIDKKTVRDFEKATGVSVKYIEDVNSNEEFFAKLQPVLAEGNRAAAASSSSPTGWRRRCTNSATCRNSNRRRSRTSRKTSPTTCAALPTTPAAQFAAPWQSGMTGVIVNKEKAPDIHSVCDLFEPQVQGQGRHAERTSRHRAAGDEVRRRRRRTRDRSRLAESDRKTEGRRRIGPDPALHRQRLLDRPDQRQRGRGDRLVRRRGAAAGRQPEHRMADARRRLHPLVGQHGDPGRLAEPDRRRGLDQLRLRPGPPGADRGLRELRQPGRRDERGPAQGRTGNRQQQADLPAAVVHEELLDPAFAEPRKKNRTSTKPSTRC